MRKLGLMDACQRLAYADGFPNFTLDSGIAMPAFDEVSYLLDDQSPKTLMQQLLRYLSRAAQQVHHRSITTVHIPSITNNAVLSFHAAFRRIKFRIRTVCVPWTSSTNNRKCSCRQTLIE